ncbi:MAG: HAD family phosphatase [Clostridia bacterium]|nr:HAD family phosphatase [Clostridia bacterium]
MNTYIFDFDGTLVDSMPYYGKAMVSVLDEHGIEYGDDILKIITPLGFMGTAKYFISLGVPLTIEELARDLGDKLFKVYSETVPAKKKVVETLAALKERGCDLNILTASPHLTLDPCVKRLGLDKLVNNVWSCDDFSTTKADPKIYEMAAKRLGKDVSEIIFIDDNPEADRTAKSTGMTVYGIYDDSSREYIDEMKSICDRYIYDFSELL